ncbi:CUE domain-containing protein 1, partial [Nematolebias whitei]|uniref:CUE domain-containing protein 1 n=1 Tax=Nematolebias whitei TaxID=451745 RepID=UPI00189ACB86
MMKRTPLKKMVFPEEQTPMKSLNSAISKYDDRLKYESKKSKSSHLSGMDPSTGDQYSAASVETASDDALFRVKLSHMGKSTRKKLFEIARSFFERTKRRKSKRMLMKLHSLGTANSTVNLLEDDEENPTEEDGLPR